MMPVRRQWLWIIVGALGLTLVAVACGGDDSRPNRTQVSQVNTVIERVEAGDIEAMRDLLQFTSLPCTDAAGSLDRPQCADGEAPDQNVEVFSANECEAAWLRRDEVEPLLDLLVAMEPSVYAAFESPQNFYVGGEYAVVFEGDDDRANEDGLKRYVAMGVEGDNGLVTGMALGCGVGEPSHFLLPHVNEGFDDWLIEPR